MAFWNIPSRAMRRMLRARQEVARRNPFFGSIIFGANLTESNAKKTVWTNGIDIFFNPDFIERPEVDPHVEGILLHDILHCAMQHPSRKKWREIKKWNEACDYAINPAIKHFFTLPKEALIRKDFEDKGPEEIYELLQQEEDKNGKGKSQDKGKQGQGQGQSGGGQPGNDPDDGERFGEMTEPPTEEEQEEAEREWKRKVAGAVEKSRKAGTLPGQLQRLVDDLIPREKVEWRELLRDMSRDAKAKTTRTWSRPNRRRLGGGEYMPGYGTDNVYRLVICFDVSGSVDHNMHKAMREEVASLLDQNLINRCTVMAVDTQVHGETDVATSEELQQWKPRGGGGTDFRSAMDHVAQMEDVVGCLFLTDMETSSFGKDPGFPVVWVDWNGGNHAVPFGRVVPYK